MGLLKREIVLVFILVGVCGFCKGNEYKVGDGVGWTIIGNVDYNQWASSKTFQVGDTLVFEYDRVFHNVMQVSRSDFHSCATGGPITTYASGNDSIAIRGPGHYFYICGFVGHCQAGQKVDIRVPKTPGPATHGPVYIPQGAEAPRAAPVGPFGPSPSPSGGESVLLTNGFFSFGIGFLFLLVAGL